MTKADLVSRIAEEAGITKKTAGMALDSVIAAIQETLQKGDKIRIVDLGSFGIIKRKARKGVNPRTNKPLNIPETTVPKFTASKALKDAIKQ
jgi:DNA-binding protein HU-beta